MDAQTGAKEYKLTDIESTEAFLKENNIEFFTNRQNIAYTNEKMRKVAEFASESMKDAVPTKSIFLWNRKKRDDELFLVVAAADQEINYQALNKYLPGVDFGQLSHCDEECL